MVIASPNDWRRRSVGLLRDFADFKARSAFLTCSRKSSNSRRAASSALFRWDIVSIRLERWPKERLVTNEPNNNRLGQRIRRLRTQQRMSLVKLDVRGGS